MSLHHYRSTRRPGQEIRLYEFWDRIKDEQLRQNELEVMSRADLLIDGLEMLCPDSGEHGVRLIREAVTLVRKAAMVAHGTFVMEAEK